MVFGFETVPDIERKIIERYVKSSLDILLLSFFKKAEISGYSALSLIHGSFGVLLSPGTLYPTLSELEQNGLIKGRQDERKKLYSLTPKGTETLAQYVAGYESFHSKIRLFFNDYPKTEKR